MPMTPKQRKIALIEADANMSEIARKLAVTPSHVSQVVRGDRRSPRVEAAIAEAIGSTADEVFGATEGVAA
jgi:transcriptional regulator with XRE-family HTH domain